MNKLSNRLLGLITVYSKIEIVASLVIVSLIIGHSIFTAVESDRIFSQTTEAEAIEP